MPDLHRTLVALFVLTVLSGLGATPGSGQEGSDDRTEEERRKAARQEQEQLQRSKEEEARSAVLGEEAAAEQARLEELGAAGQVLLEGERGFFVRIDAFLADTSGGERTVARVGTVSSTATTAEELDSEFGDPTAAGNGFADAFTITDERSLRLRYDSELTPQLELGWRTGRGSAVSVRYWALSQDASMAATSFFEVPTAAGEPGLVVGGIDNPGRENAAGALEADPAAFRRPFGSPELAVTRFLTGADSVVATGELEASRLDLTYQAVGFARRRVELHYRVGLSWFSAERKERATYTWRSFVHPLVQRNAKTVETATSVSDSSGLGGTAGITGRFRLSDEGRWTIRLGLDVAGVRQDQELRFRDERVETQDGREPETSVAIDTRNDSTESLLVALDADVAVEARLGRGFRLGIGYRHASWLDAIGQESYPDPANPSALLSSSADLDLTGPYVRLGYFF